MTIYSKLSCDKRFNIVKKNIPKILRNTEYIKKIIFSLLGSVIILFILFPLAKMFVSVEKETFIEVLEDKEVINAIWLTLTSSFWATLFTIVFGIPLAHILARQNFIGKSVIEGIIDIPVIIPHAAAGIALLFVFGEKTLLGQFFDLFGIHFVGAVPGIVVGMTFVSLPFLVNSAKVGFKLVDPRLTKVARTLGSSPLRSFFTIDLYLARKAVLSGILMMWGRGISEFGAVVILTYHPMTASILIFERFGAYGLKYSRPVALLLIGICLIVFIIIRSFSGVKNTQDAKAK